MRGPSRSHDFVAGPPILIHHGSTGDAEPVPVVQQTVKHVIAIWDGRPADAESIADTGRTFLGRFCDGAGAKKSRHDCDGHESKRLCRGYPVQNCLPPFFVVEAVTKAVPAAAVVAHPPGWRPLQAEAPSPRSTATIRRREPDGCIRRATVERFLTSFFSWRLWNSGLAAALFRRQGGNLTMVRITTRARHAITHAAQRGAKNVKTVAGEALGAAAKAATDVVLERTAAALASGKAKLSQAAPAIRRAAGKAAKRSVDKPARRKKANRARRSTARRKRAAAPVARRRKKTKARSRR